jgi:hypothetical protein
METEPPDTVSTSPPAKSLSQRAVPGAANAGSLAVPVDFMDNAIRNEARKALGPVRGRLYFIGVMGAAPTPDKITLRVVGGEPVSIRSIEIKDDMLSPFGMGAAAHFTFSSVPNTSVIEPDAPVDIQVEFLGDTTSLQNAVLEVTTDAENTPFLEIGLTGKITALY